MLVPKSITCLKGYTKEQFMKDFSAGIIVAIIALPLSIALAIASGVSPEKGLYTAIIGGFIVSLLGGSRVQIGGPTGAFVVIVYGIVQKYGMDGLLISTIMAGIFLILMGLLKLGGLIKYIPSSITSGFTSGIAIVILSTQVKDFLGLTMSSVPSEFLAKWTAYINSMNTINIQSLFIAILTLLIIIFWPKISKKIPGTFVAIIIATIITMVFNLKVDTIGSQFGELSSALPKLVVPNVSFEMINQLMLPALTIAILAGVESLLSAVVADGMIGGKHRSNMELIAEGVANIFSGMFGGIPVTGAIARTAANVKNGGRTPVAGIVHSFGILIIMMLFMPYVKLIPMASLASILVLVAYNMMEWEAFKQIFKAPKGDALVFIVTFILTIFLDLVVAIGVGVVLSSFLFMKKMAEVTDVKYIVDDINDDEISDVISNVKTPKDVSIYEISGPFFFGAANKFVNAVREMGTPPKILIIKMESVPFIDATAYHSLEMLHDLCEKHHTKLIILQIQEGPLKVLKNYGFTKLLGEDNFCNDMDGAIERAKALKVRS
ncbi:SulP family inorganic anion transporter [Clostridium algidicarnis]|uniref:SulP family inorganic anion transporter n=1 Tax=Clostridium algidicarnis TaxID=37659 RepID=UPI001C0D1B2C|nr:sulfate permease [Clostridium algidicarnis]MBU3229171.1 sulfate permease [Clostridium algidicarnis]MBU3252692.1 sulfate permease [Clostridium algidicarnis]